MLAQIGDVLARITPEASGVVIIHIVFKLITHAIDDEAKWRRLMFLVVPLLILVFALAGVAVWWLLGDGGLQVILPVLGEHTHPRPHDMLPEWPLPSGERPCSARFLHVSEDSEPDWLAELAKGGEALRRQIEPIAQAAEQFVRDARRAKTTGGPPLPFSQRIALAVDAGMRELLPARAVAHQRTAALTVPVTFAAVAKVATGGGLALSPMVFVSDGDVATVTESEAVQVLDSPTGLAALSDGQIVFLVLVWLYAFVLPWFGSALSPEFHAILSDHYATIAIALGITWRMLDKNK